MFCCANRDGFAGSVKRCIGTLLKVEKQDMDHKKRDLLFTLAATFFWGLIAHGYCYFNLFYSHDSLYVYQNDAGWQISLGRFLQPLYIRLRGNIYTPSLVGLLSLVFIGISVWLIMRLFNIRDKFLIILSCGILTVNTTVTLLNATYIEWIDIFTLSLLLAVGSVYLCRNVKYGAFLSAILLVCSLGLYQAYLQVAVFLHMMFAVLDLLRNEDFFKVIKNGLRAIGSMLLGLVAYYVTLKIVLRRTGIELANNYNGLTNVGKYDGIRSILGYIKTTYRNVFTYFKTPVTYHSKITGWVNLALALIAFGIIVLLVYSRKLERKSILLLAGLLALMPFGINVVCFISKGMEHDLMIYSFNLFYIFVAVLFIEAKSLPVLDKYRDALVARYWLPFLIGIVLFNNLIYANQAYMKKALEYQSTLSTMSRIVDRMEETDGYVLGETPVVFVGALSSSELSAGRAGFDLAGTGLEANCSVTYYLTYGWYFKYVLAYPINLLDSTASAEWSEQEEVLEMSAFPARNSCKIIDGTMVVKLSN
jgi:hypothetical protein